MCFCNNVTCLSVIFLPLLYFNWQTETLNRRPSAAELFAATHSKVDESGHRVWCDSYAHGVYISNETINGVVWYILYETINSSWIIVSCLIFSIMQEKYEQLKLGLNGQVGAEADDHLFFKACGGYNNKGRVYGLGSEGPSMFERPSRARGSTSGASSCTCHRLSLGCKINCSPPNLSCRPPNLSYRPPKNAYAQQRRSLILPERN